jgi:hypothetical protein
MNNYNLGIKNKNMVLENYEGEDRDNLILKGSWYDVNQINYLEISENIGFYLFGIEEEGINEKPKLFCSIDIEANGPAPGLFSMIQFGIVICDIKGKILFKIRSNLKEMEGAGIHKDTLEWLQKQPTYENMMKNRKNPKDIFIELHNLFTEINKRFDVDTVMAPSAYDKQWLSYYFAKYCGELSNNESDNILVLDENQEYIVSGRVGTDPTGFGGRCIISYIAGMTGSKSLSRSKCGFNDYKDESLEHTHDALDDALEQLSAFINAYITNTSKN